MAGIEYRDMPGYNDFGWGHVRILEERVEGLGLIERISVKTGVSGVDTAEPVSPVDPGGSPDCEVYFQASVETLWKFDEEYEGREDKPGRIYADLDLARLTRKCNMERSLVLTGDGVDYSEEFRKELLGGRDEDLY